jgi:hypothetical protein
MRNPRLQVNAGIRTSRSHLIVRNKDSSDWTEKTIYLNGTPPFTFRFTIDGLKAGETVSLPLIDHMWQTRPNPIPAFVEPMKARLVTELPVGPEWLYEQKLDGYRAIAIKEADRVRLLSGRGNDFTNQFPQVAQGHCVPRRRNRGLVEDQSMVL